MNKIIRIKKANLCLMIIAMLYFNLAKAQPGWQDLTKRYFYTILDKNGQEFSFKNNSDYSIMIDSVLYKSSNIPNDSIKTLTVSSSWKPGFENLIKINDFSLVNYQNDYYRSKKQLEIKIIHKKDTMYICQPSAIGSKSIEWLDYGRKIGYETVPKTDLTLQFIAGHYYFPSWFSDEILNIETSGSVKIINANQHHFIVSKSIYENLSLNYDMSNWENQRKLFDNTDEEIVNRFINGYYSVEKRTEPVKFTNVVPYKEPKWDRYYMNQAKQEDNVYFGYITYYKDSSGNNTHKNVFSRYNCNENTVEHWFPTNFKIDKSSLFIDTFNNVLYQKGLVYEKHLSKEEEHIPPRKYIYQSTDEGKTWIENEALSELFNQYDFQHIRFLDKNYSLTFNNRIIKHKKTKHDIKQVRYYLLKNMKIIDSLEVPNDVVYHYSDYWYSDSPFSTKDTIVIGSWKTNKKSNLKSYRFASVLNNEEEWNFTTTLGWDNLNTKYINSQAQNLKDTIKEFQNFTLINKRELVFKNDSGSLKLKNPINDEFGVIEQEKQIYLVYTSKDLCCLLFSYDGGIHWYLYPKCIYEWDIFKTMHINEQGVITYFDGEKMEKVYHKFTLE